TPSAAGPPRAHVAHAEKRGATTWEMARTSVSGRRLERGRERGNTQGTRQPGSVDPAIGFRQHRTRAHAAQHRAAADAGPNATTAGLARRRCVFGMDSGQFDGGAGGLELFLGVVRGVLVDTLEDRLRRALDEFLGLLEAQAREAAD